MSTIGVDLTVGTVRTMPSREKTGLSNQKSRPKIRLNADTSKPNLVTVTCLEVSDVDSQTTLLRVPKSVRIRVLTPRAEQCLIYLVETTHELLISNSELLLGRALGLESIDAFRIVVKSHLGQAPLVPTVLSDVQVLVPCCEYMYDGDIRSVRNLVHPIPGSRMELLETLLDAYRQSLRNIELIGVLCSSGWDSRLETACVARVASEQGSRLRLLHLCGEPRSRAIVTAVADEIGAQSLIVDAHTEALRYANEFEWNPIKNPTYAKLLNYSTWRPSIPMYQGLVNESVNDELEIVFGFTPYELRGRQYDLPISSTPPDRGRLRAVDPRPSRAPIPDFLDHVIRDQTEVWTSVAKLCEDWEVEARIDYMLWVLNMGFSYSHRVNQVVWPEIRPLTCHEDVVSRFLGLSPAEKIGTQFVEWAITVLNPRLASIPVVSSSGEMNRGTGSDRRRVPLGMESVDFGKILLDFASLTSRDEVNLDSISELIKGQRDRVAARQILEFCHHLACEG